MIPATEATRNYIAQEIQKYMSDYDLELGVIVLVFQRELTPKIAYCSNVSNLTAVSVLQEAAKNRMADEAAKQVN